MPPQGRTLGSLYQALQPSRPDPNSLSNPAYGVPMTLPEYAGQTRPTPMTLGEMVKAAIFGGMLGMPRPYRQDPQYERAAAVGEAATLGLPLMAAGLSKTAKATKAGKTLGQLAEAPSEYRGLHTSPGRDAAPLHDLTGGGKVYPDDVYSPQQVRYYGDASGHDPATFRLVNYMKGKPDAPVTVFRAVPKNAQDTINPGDWVTINRGYAESHGQGPLGGDFKIVSKQVKASDIFTNGDSIHEWGYHPAPNTSKAPVAAEELSAFTQAVKQALPGLKEFDLRPRANGDIHLETIAVGRGQAGQGLGTQAMQALEKFADSRGARIVLSPSEKGYQPVVGGPKTTSPARLEDFYSRFGFKPNRGGKRDFSISDAMVRNPKEKAR